MRAFYLSTFRNYPLPELRWERWVDEKGVSKIVLNSDRAIPFANGWIADTKETCEIVEELILHENLLGPHNFKITNWCDINIMLFFMLSEWKCTKGNTRR